MLRHVMGDTAFFGALADYRTGHEHDAAVTDDFQAALEARYGASLDWFFGPWVYGVGTPRYALAWNSTAVGDSFRVRVEIRQTQPLSEPTYTMPIDLRIATAAGPVDVVAWNDARAEAFSFMTAAAPSAVTLDPGHWVLQVVDPFPTSVATHDPGDVAGSRPLPDLTVSPNPARDAVMMALRAPQDAPAELAIHDVRGRLIRWWRLPAGFEEVRAIPWDRRDDAGRRVGPGIYFARLSVGAGSVERKILLLP
jgi:hypothetical protein